MYKKIVVICIESESNVTESSFFTKIADASKQLFENIEIIFYSFNHSIEEKNKNKIFTFIKSIFTSTLLLEEHEKIKYVFFVIHDDESENDRVSLNKSFDYIKHILEDNWNLSPIRIVESGKTFDYFLYYIFNDTIAKSSKEVKKFMDDNNFKKSGNNMWKLLYVKFNTVDLRGVKRLEKTIHLIYKMKSNEFETYKIFDEFNINQNGDSL